MRLSLPGWPRSCTQAKHAGGATVLGCTAWQVRRNVSLLSEIRKDLHSLEEGCSPDAPGLGRSRGEGGGQDVPFEG
jgi:hypothetical protein